MAKKPTPPAKTVKKRLMKRDVIAFFGSEKATADALAISVQAVNNWRKWVPEQRTWHILALHPELNTKAVDVAIEYKLVTIKVERQKYVKVA